MANIEEMKILVEKYLNHSASAAERERICEWMKTDEDIKMWFQSQINYSSNELDSDVKESIYRSIYSESDSTKRRVGWQTLLLSVAACFLAVVASVSITKYIYTNNQRVEALTVYTNTGDRSNVTLPDGTEVDLNAKSKITYYFDSETQSRVVTLTGEAFFEVAKDPERPFYVSVDDLKVHCLGTKFNVSAYPESSLVSVVLSDGKVNVASDIENVTITPDTRVCYDRKTHRLSRQKVDAINYCEWMDGYLYFDNERFDDIAKSISRNYGVTVNIISRQLKEEKFTGTIYQADIKNILNILTAASGSKYEIISDSLINLSY